MAQKEEGWWTGGTLFPHFEQFGNQILIYGY